MKKYTFTPMSKFMNEPCKNWTHTHLNGKAYKLCGNCAGCMGIKLKLQAKENDK